ncbi:MAG: YscO family type III secretion system apparatus protein [Pseudomonadota bacterium]
MRKKYALGDLHKVKKIREDLAVNTVVIKRRCLEEAEKILKKKEQDLLSYKAWRQQAEETLYQEIINTPVRLKNLDELQIKVKMMRDEELSLEKKLIEAANQGQKANEDLLGAREVYRNARKEKEKIEEHRKAWLKEKVREAKIRQAREITSLPTLKGNFMTGDPYEQDF